MEVALKKFYQKNVYCLVFACSFTFPIELMTFLLVHEGLARK